MKETRIEGLPLLLDLVEQGRDRNRGLLTISNHISTLDDPMLWGMMPFSTYLDTSKARWTLGAADILFTNRLIAPLFHHGQVIKTIRGDGIYQPAIDLAIDKLNNFQWVHIFPEGKVNQPVQVGPRSHYELLRFKWGISRLVLETKMEPIVLPIWLQGFDKVMPDGRPSPWNLLPRLNQSLSIKISDPINGYPSKSCGNNKNQNKPVNIKHFRRQYQALLSSKDHSAQNPFEVLKEHEEAKRIRTELASSLRSEFLAVRPSQ